MRFLYVTPLTNKYSYQKEYFIYFEVFVLESVSEDRPHVRTAEVQNHSIHNLPQERVPRKTSLIVFRITTETLLCHFFLLTNHKLKCFRPSVPLALPILSFYFHPDPDAHMGLFQYSCLPAAESWSPERHTYIGWIFPSRVSCMLLFSC